mgnify:CR=1 FL=1
MKSTCKVKGCNEPKMKCPGNNDLYFSKCQSHQIEYVLGKQKADMIKDKAGLETMRKTGKKTTTSEKKKALKLADSWFSKYIRFKNAYYHSGMYYCRCYTCNNEYPILTMDCGHWQKRQHIATRFNENNARPQCTSCNDYNKGEYAKFEVNLIDEIGLEETEKIKQLAKTIFHDSIEYFRSVAEAYRIECNNLFKEKNIKNIWRG